MKYWRNSKYYILFILLLQGILVHSQRQDILLNNDWLSIAREYQNDDKAPEYMPPKTDPGWIKVNVPHNWDQYQGYRRLIHGNFHGSAWYRKSFSIKQNKSGKRFFLYFEGAGSFTKVYLNGVFAGEHAGGRTSFTIDITDKIKTDGSLNQIAVSNWHPSFIQNLPWVCGGCSDERGFSEGSQPLGIFRPVHLIVTNDVRISPFGVHAWAEIKGEEVQLNVNTSFKNYSNKGRKLVIAQQLLDQWGKLVDRFQVGRLIRVGDSLTVEQSLKLKGNPVRWSVERPYLYTIETVILENNKVIDRVSTPFGFRTINWKTASHQFMLNDKPVFINGIAEYEHLLGQSHAFSREQIISRINWVQSAGFNAFRDGHQPHNLLYGELCDQRGLLWWTQLSAHVWYDTPEFRKNFKELLREWVIERRNSPSVILWGLQNESKLPEAFAKECTELIRSLDPTASSQRLVTTCNGGRGTDWDVPQNWTGTYGGNPDEYANDLKKQVLVGEYGAWRSIDLHSEGGFKPDGPLSEDRFTSLMEKKVRLAESVKDSVAGHFFWLLTSHDNPGRVQGGEGLREIDRIGPVNYKGLLTPWEEPTDAYYMFRSNYVSAEKDPMVYIASHTWPTRWLRPGIRNGIVVYSNCEEVELFNDIDLRSLGKKRRNGVGTHFQWDSVNIRYSVLYAVGYQKGVPVARDTIILRHLPSSAYYDVYDIDPEFLKPAPGYKYIHRINCGGPVEYDDYGQRWEGDKGFARSWATDFPELPELFASQRRTFSPLRKVRKWELFQDFRYGKDKLVYQFNNLQNGNYRVELYFIEPWIGIGGEKNAIGKRIFDVAINGKTVIDDLDIWKEAGVNSVLKKVVNVKVTDGKMIISFPETKAGEALISAIALAVSDKSAPAPVYKMKDTDSPWLKDAWMDIGQQQFTDYFATINSLPPFMYGADRIIFKSYGTKEKLVIGESYAIDLYVSVQDPSKYSSLLKGFENTGTSILTGENDGEYYKVFRLRVAAGDKKELDADGRCIIAWQPASKMQPAYDLKPITAYRSNVAIISDNIKKDSLGGRICCIINDNKSATIDWPVQTGVGDIYSITLKYYYPENQPAKGRLQLYDAGNNRMMDEEVQFTFTREGKWNQFTVNTGTQINAGNYKVRLVMAGGNKLAVSGIEIQ